MKLMKLKLQGPLCVQATSMALYLTKKKLFIEKSIKYMVVLGKDYTSSVQLISFYKLNIPAKLAPISGKSTLPTAQNITLSTSNHCLCPHQR